MCNPEHGGVRHFDSLQIENSHVSKECKSAGGRCTVPKGTLTHCKIKKIFENCRHNIKNL